MTQQSTVTLASLTAHVAALDRGQAPGSESALWGDYLTWAEDTTGTRPIGDYEDVPVPGGRANWDWWTRAYAYQAEHAGGEDYDRDELVSSVDGGDRRELLAAARARLKRAIGGA